MCTNRRPPGRYIPVYRKEKETNFRVKKNPRGGQIHLSNNVLIPIRSHKTDTAQWPLGVGGQN